MSKERNANLHALDRQGIFARRCKPQKVRQSSCSVRGGGGYMGMASVWAISSHMENKKKEEKQCCREGLCFVYASVQCRIRKRGWNSLK